MSTHGSKDAVPTAQTSAPRPMARTWTLARMVGLALALGGLAVAAPPLAPDADASSGPYVATSLSTGTWSMNVNGRLRTLEVRGVRADGTIDARMQNTAQVRGSWDEAAKRLQFTRIIDPKRPRRNQEYTGYLLDDNPEGRNRYDYVAGSFTDNGPASTRARRNYGWYMQVGR